MKLISKPLFLSVAFGLASVGLANAATTVTPITSYDPNTFFSGGITAGIDFDSGTSSNYPDPTASGFLGVNTSSRDTISVTHNSIDFDIVITGTNAGNQNRNRNNVNGGALLTDFVQWYNNTNSQVEAAFTFSGLKANYEYDITFFNFNIGAGQNTSIYYEGTSSSDPLLTTFSTSGNQNNYSTWSPGVTFRVDSGADSAISLTAQSNVGSGRLTVNGVSIVEVGPIPEPSSVVLLGLGGLGLGLRRRR